MELHFKSEHDPFKLDVAFKLAELDTLGIYGPSGAGKSTLLNMIAGLRKPDSGYLSFNGEPLFDSKRNINMPIHRRRIGLVFQDSRLFPHLNVQENLNYGYHLVATKDRRFHLTQIVELLELSPLLQHRPDQLSGGEKQRVALGRALLTSPRLLLMDEPLASLDTRLKQQILPFLRRVKHELNIPMIYVSHALDEILYLTSNIAMMNQGQLLAIGPFHEVIHQLPVLSIAQSLGLENVLHGQVHAHLPEEGYSVIMLNDQLLHIPLIQGEIGTIATVSVAASNVALSLRKIEGITIQNQLAGVVQAVQNVRHKTLVTIQLDQTDAQIMAEVTAKSVQDLHLNPERKVYCLIKTQSIHPLAILE